MKTFYAICEQLNKENDLIFEKVCETLDERLNDGAVGQYGCDLHHYLFNEEYAFIRDDVAESAIDSVNVWSAIRLVRQYELDNFGKNYIEITPRKIANMLTYIYGEFLLAQVEYLQGDAWDRELTEEDVEQVKEELMAWLENNLPTDEHWNKRTLDGQIWDYYGAY